MAYSARHNTVYGTIEHIDLGNNGVDRIWCERA